MNSGKIEKIYGGKVRLRVCGILNHDDKVLLINHKGLNPKNEFWNFPGGGLEKNESIEKCLQREFLEETGLNVEIGTLKYINEHISKKLHAVELYFQAFSTSFEAVLGKDPEINILTDLKWFNKTEINDLNQDFKPSFLDKIAF